MLYYAYGSNVNWQRMPERCPSKRCLGIALPENHNLAFTRKSANRGCKSADAVREDGHAAPRSYRFTVWIAHASRC